MKKNINEELKEEELAESISKTIDNDLVKIQEVLDLDLKNLVDIVDSLSNDKKDKVLSLIINKQLEKLKESLTMDIYNKVSRNVDEITDYYSSKKDGFDAVVEEGDNVANDILFKVIGHHDRKLELPIDVDILKKYCFSTDLREEQFYDTLMWIALRYFAISESISYYQWKDKYEKDLKSSN